MAEGGRRVGEKGKPKSAGVSFFLCVRGAGACLYKCHFCCIFFFSIFEIEVGQRGEGGGGGVDGGSRMCSPPLSRLT